MKKKERNLLSRYFLFNSNQFAWVHFLQGSKKPMGVIKSICQDLKGNLMEMMVEVFVPFQTILAQFWFWFCHNTENMQILCKILPQLFCFTCYMIWDSLVKSFWFPLPQLMFQYHSKVSSYFSRYWENQIGHIVSCYLLNPK